MKGPCTSQKNEKGQGAYEKGKSPWQQAFNWLWQKKFPQWQAKQSSRVGADAAPMDTEFNMPVLQGELEQQTNESKALPKKD